MSCRGQIIGRLGVSLLLMVTPWLYAKGVMLDTRQGPFYITGCDLISDISQKRTQQPTPFKPKVGTIGLVIDYNNGKDETYNISWSPQRPNYQVSSLAELLSAIRVTNPNNGQEFRIFETGSYRPISGDPIAVILNAASVEQTFHQGTRTWLRWWVYRYKWNKPGQSGPVGQWPDGVWTYNLDQVISVEELNESLADPQKPLILGFRYAASVIPTNDVEKRERPDPLGYPEITPCGLGSLSNHR